MTFDEALKELEKDSWVKEVELTELLYAEVKSIRRLQGITGRYKNWIHTSLILARYLRVMPELEKCKTRNEAFRKIKQYKKQTKLLKDLGIV